MFATANSATTTCHVMIDLETLGTAPTAPVITIGAVLFDPRVTDTVDELRTRGFYRRIDLADAVRNSGGADPDTLAWWFAQSDSAIKALVAPGTGSVRNALKDLMTYCRERNANVLQGMGADPGIALWPKADIMWAKSPDFDGKILEAACDKVQLPRLFTFYAYRCVRTLQDLAWPNGPTARPKFDVGTAHNALDDAISQALTVQAGYQKLGLGI